MKTEVRFIAELEQKAKEQQRLTQTELMPRWARRMGGWLVVNPWRVLIPLSGIWYLVVRSWYGVSFREFTLGLFGGFK